MSAGKRRAEAARPGRDRSASAPGAAGEMHLARQARLVAVVLAVTMVGWVLLQWIGGHYGWPARLVFLFDLAALAAFAWSLIVTARIWRARRRG